MGNDAPRITGPTLKVISQLMAAPLKGMSGSEISKETGLSSGTLYPLLFRLEKAGWLSSEWETLNPSEAGRPRKRFYTLTGHGVREATEAFKDVAHVNGRLVWES
jgi:PadR family transcriptional regulator PadR